MTPELINIEINITPVSVQLSIIDFQHLIEAALNYDIDLFHRISEHLEEINDKYDATMARS